MNRLVATLFVVLGTLVTVFAQQGGTVRSPDVIFVPTDQAVVEAMLKIAQVGPGDVLFDLGSGDGRIPIAAAKIYGIRAVGIELDPQRIREANAAARAAGVDGKVRFLNQDLFEADIREATVVTLFLLPSLNLRLIPKLNSELKMGSRIVSHEFDMGKARPLLTQQIGGRTVYLWRTPIG